MDDNELLAASEAYEVERKRWLTRRNKANPSGSQWEVVRGAGEDEPISEDTVKVHMLCYDHETADYEMEIARGIASMRAALGQQLNAEKLET